MRDYSVKREAFLKLSSPWRGYGLCTPAKILVWTLRLIIPHAHEEGMKILITPIMRSSGGIRGDPPSRSEVA